MIKISGTVEDIIYRNEENGYTVLVLDSGGEPITAVGNLPMLSEGEFLELEGEYRLNSKYGIQFFIKSISTSAPQTIEGITRFLASGFIKGVKDITAAKIVSKFGKDTFDIIQNNPERLAEIKGISLEKAAAISEDYKRVHVMRETLIYLQSYDISPSLAMKIYKAYDENTRSILETNPYQLVEDIDGIGFLTADKIAVKSGINPSSDFRLRAGIIYILKTAAERNGHTYLPQDELTQAVLETLKINRTLDDLQSFYERMAIEGKLKIYSRPEHKCIALSSLFYSEKSIAQRLLALLASTNDLPKDYSQEIEKYEQRKGYKFDNIQKQAIRSCLNDGVMVITGGPGTGKTTIISCVLDILKREGYRFLLTAPTGRAAKRLQDATGEEAMTIHRALVPNFQGFGFLHNENNLLEYDYIIVDEVSMVDTYLMSALLKAIPSGAHLILLGDKDQLPSVGAGNVLADILSSGRLNVTYLKHIYRQGNESNIVYNAHLINNGEMPIISNSVESDFFFSRQSTQEQILNAIVSLVTERIPNRYNISPYKIQVLAPMKNGPAGVNNLNINLQQSLNPPAPNKPQITYGSEIFRLGDKVMHIANNYELEWQRQNENGVITEGSGVFNGDMGIIIEVNPQTSELVVLFEDGRQSKYNYENLEELMLAYAMTVHKSQGCEFEAVIIALTGGSYMICTRNLLYTAVTRAKNIAVLVGAEYTLQKMVENTYTQVRYTMLESLLSEQPALF